MVGGAGRKRGSQFFEWRVPSLYWVYQIRDALAALTRNEVEGSKFLSLTANLSLGVHEWFTSRLGNCFYRLLYSTQIGIGIGEGGKKDIRKDYNKWIHPFLKIFNYRHRE